MPRWLILMNRAAGTLLDGGADDPGERVRAVLAAHGIEAEVRACPGAELGATARNATGFDTIVAAGGDGTVGAVATALLGTGRPMGVIPLGTFNHFAKDLGVPLDVEAAAEALARGEPEEVPVAELDGRVFLNFSAVGLHPELAEEREAQRQAGRSRWLAVALAFTRAIRRFPLLRARLVLPVRTLWRVTPGVIVCVNPYQMRAFGVADASYPDRRVLNVYVARSRNPLRLLWLFVRAFFGRVEGAADFEAIATTSLDLHVGHGPVRVSLDGELCELRSPLRYRIAAAALTVVRPVATSPAGAPSNRGEGTETGTSDALRRASGGRS
jgi:diacylglycerol kinase family enzyme